MVSFLYTQLMTSVLTFAEGIGGLNDLWTSVRQDWLAPLFLAAVAVCSIMFIKNRQWTALISFIGVAVIVAVLMFGGSLFVSNTGDLGSVGKIGQGAAEKLNGGQ